MLSTCSQLTSRQSRMRRSRVGRLVVQWTWGQQESLGLPHGASSLAPAPCPEQESSQALNQPSRPALSCRTVFKSVILI